MGQKADVDSLRDFLRGHHALPFNSLRTIFRQAVIYLIDFARYAPRTVQPSFDSLPEQ